jgi:metal-responsive CopG/Arc/MetJ family transcriptional regulator
MLATPPLPDELIQKVEDCALAENKQPAEVLEEAVRKYLDDRSWAKLVEYGRERGAATGYQGEEGVDRAIAEYRAEKRAR